MRTTAHLPLTLALAAAACGAPKNDDALERTNGGYDTTNEAPLFDDTTFALTAERDADPSAAAATTGDDTELRTRDRIALTIIWGHREALRTDTTFTDWSGSLTTRGAAIGKVRTIRFDRADHLLPRESRDTLAWVSRTRPHHDGLQVTLLRQPELATASEGSIKFETTPFAIEIPIAELDHYDRVFDVGDEQVAIQAFRARPEDCATGTIRGIWSDPNEGGIGRLHGRVLDDAGEVKAHLRGRYGTRDDGRQVFFAKVIDRAGNFVGRVRGQWADGEFKGHFEGRKGHHGAVRGRYLEGRPDRTTSDRFGGLFLGRWAETCRDRPTTMPMDDMPADDMGDGSEPVAPAEGDNTPLVP